MSWATCCSGSNNIDKSSPARMDDGRFFTNYNLYYESEPSYKTSLNVGTNHEYRKYLVNNTEYIMRRNRQVYCDHCCHCESKPDSVLNPTKYLYKSCTDHTTPYGYESSDLKNIYLSRQGLNSRLYAPMVSQDKLLMYKVHQ